MYIVFDHVYPISMHQPQAELGWRNENSVEVCRSHFKRDGNAGVWGAWGAHLRIFSCTLDICLFDNCTKDICRFAPIFQRKVTFRIVNLKIAARWNEAKLRFRDLPQQGWIQWSQQQQGLPLQSPSRRTSLSGPGSTRLMMVVMREREIFARFVFFTHFLVYFLLA